MEFQGFVLVTVYVPNSGDKLQRLRYRVDEWDKNLAAYAMELEVESGKPVILCGDFNVAHDVRDFHQTYARSESWILNLES